MNDINFAGLILFSLLIILYSYSIIINYKIKNQMNNLVILFLVIVLLISDLFLNNNLIYIKGITQTVAAYIILFLYVKYNNFSYNKKMFLLGLIFVSLIIAGFTSALLVIAGILRSDVYYFILLVIQIVFEVYVIYTYFVSAKKYAVFKLNKKIALISILSISLFLMIESVFLGSVMGINYSSDASKVFLSVTNLVMSYGFSIFIFGILIVRIFMDEYNKVENLSEYDKTKEKDINILNIIQNMIIESEEYESSLNNLLNIATFLTEADGGIVYMYNKDKNTFEAKLIKGYALPPYFVSDKLIGDDKIIKKILSTDVDADKGLFGTVMSTKKIILIKNEQSDPNRRYLSYLRDYESNIYSLMVGLIMDKNNIEGIIYLNKILNFEESDVSTFESVCTVAGVLLSNIRSKMLTKEKDRLENEMKIAEQIQTGILPKNYNIPGYSVLGFMRTAEEVGGDYFDIINGPEGKFWITMGDVTGHGVTAGLIALMLQTLVNGFVNTAQNLNPKKLTAICNKIMFDNIKNRLYLDQFVTSCFISGNEKGEFEYSGAHLDILVYRRATRKVDVLKTNGVWLGLLDDISSQSELNKFNMEKDDVMFLFTDGLIEIKDKDDVQYDMHRLKSFLENNGYKPVEEIKNELMAEIDKFKLKQDDDITMVILKKEI